MYLYGQVVVKMFSRMGDLIIIMNKAMWNKRIEKMMIMLWGKYLMDIFLLYRNWEFSVFSLVAIWRNEKCLFVICFLVMGVPESLSLHWKFVTNTMRRWYKLAQCSAFGSWTAYRFVRFCIIIWLCGISYMHRMFMASTPFVSKKTSEMCRVLETGLWLVNHKQWLCTH